MQQCVAVFQLERLADTNAQNTRSKHALLLIEYSWCFGCGILGGLEAIFDINEYVSHLAIFTDDRILAQQRRRMKLSALAFFF